MKPIYTFTIIILGTLFGHAQEKETTSPEYAAVVAEYDKAQPVSFPSIEGKLFFGQCFYKTKNLVYYNAVEYSFTNNIGPISSRKYSWVAESSYNENDFRNMSESSRQDMINGIRAGAPSIFGQMTEQEKELLSPFTNYPQITHQIRITDKSHLVVLSRLHQDLVGPNYTSYKKGDFITACYLYLNK